MRALVLNGDKFAVEERPMPEPDVGEVLFRTHFSGICGTDLHAPDLNFYTPGVVIGHEFAGEVAAVGPGVEEWQAGDRATVHPRGNFCGTCYECRHGWPNICSSDEFCAPAGSVRDGGMAAYVEPSGGQAATPSGRSLPCWKAHGQNRFRLRFAASAGPGSASDSDCRDWRGSHRAADHDASATRRRERHHRD